MYPSFVWVCLVEPMPCCTRVFLGVLWPISNCHFNQCGSSSLPSGDRGTCSARPSPTQTSITRPFPPSSTRKRALRSTHTLHPQTKHHAHKDAADTSGSLGRGVPRYVTLPSPTPTLPPIPPIPRAHTTATGTVLHSSNNAFLVDAQRMRGASSNDKAAAASPVEAAAPLSPPQPEQPISQKPAKPLLKSQEPKPKIRSKEKARLLEEEERMRTQEALVEKEEEKEAYLSPPSKQQQRLDSTEAFAPPSASQGIAVGEPNPNAPDWEQSPHNPHHNHHHPHHPSHSHHSHFDLEEKLMHTHPHKAREEEKEEGEEEEDEWHDHHHRHHHHEPRYVRCS